MPTIAALLAAGSGSRFGGDGHKLLADLHGRPVWQHALDAVVAAGFAEVVVVTGAARLALPDGVRECHNPDWQQGQATSLQVAVRAAAAAGVTALVVGLADQPFVTADAWRAVRDAEPSAPIVVAVYGGEVGPNPVRLGREVWPLLPTDGDLGAREVIRAHPEWVSRVDCLGSVADIDTLEDLERWRSC